MKEYFEINKYAFLYGDYDYFHWFAGKTKKTRENLRNVIKWKRLRRGSPDVNKIWDEEKHDLDGNKIKNLRFGIVTRAFLFHLKWPDKYPIFDRNVFKAMSEIENKKSKENITNWQDYEKYIAFFERFYKEYKKEIENLNLPDLQSVPKEIIKKRVLDRALWEFGRINEAASNF